MTTPGSKLVDFEPRVEARPTVLDAVGDGEGHLKRSGSPSLLQVVPRDWDGVELQGKAKISHVESEKKLTQQYFVLNAIIQNTIIIYYSNH